MTVREGLVGGLLIGVLVCSALAFRVLHAPWRMSYRTEATEWSQLETRLNYLGIGGWELVALAPDRSNPKIVWATLLRRGSARALRRGPPPREKKKGRGEVPAYNE